MEGSGFLNVSLLSWVLESRCLPSFALHSTLHWQCLLEFAMLCIHIHIHIQSSQNLFSSPFWCSSSCLHYIVFVSMSHSLNQHCVTRLLSYNKPTHISLPLLTGMWLQTNLAQPIEMLKSYFKFRQNALP